MKKIVALVLSLVMALSLCTVAFAVEDGDTFYDGTTKGVAKKYTYVDKYTAGAVNYLPHFVEQTTDGTWYLVGTKGTVMYDEDLKATDLYLGDAMKSSEVDKGLGGDYAYQFKATVQEAQTWSCTQDQLKKGYVYTNAQDETCYAVDYKASNTGATIYLLVDGKIVKANAYEPVTGQHILYYTGSKMTEVKVGVFQVKCAACQKDILISKDNINGAGYLYENDYTTYEAWSEATGKTASVPVNATFVTGSWYVLDAGKTTTDTTKDGVDSAKTFDAGVAMYVGMSLLSVAGGAVVIGKKKEF